MSKDFTYLLKSDRDPKLRETLYVILMLAWPAILEQIMITLVQYVDTAMVGSLGAVATASVGLVSTSVWMFNGLFNAAAVGFSVQVAQRLGAGEYHKAQQVVWQALRFVILFGVIMGSIGVAVSFPLPALLNADTEIRGGASLYFRIIACAMPFTFGANMFSAILRCSGDTKTPMVLNILINVLNVTLNFLFIYPVRTLTVFGTSFTMWGAGWGVGGAAFASACSTTTVCILFALVIFRRKSNIQINFRECHRFEKRTLLTVWKLGLPVALERVTMNIAQLIITRVISGIGTVAVAANHLAVTAESVSYMPAFGVSTAGTTLVGQAMGAGRKDLAKKFSHTVIWIGILIMTCGGLLLFTLAPRLIMIFTKDAAVIELGSRVLRIVAFAEPLFGASIVAGGALRGAGDARVPFLLNLCSMWGVRITLSLLLSGSLGLVGVWIAMAAELCVRGTIFAIRLYRGKWLEIDLFGDKKKTAKNS